MKIQVAVIAVSLWMGIGAESVFAVSRDTCNFGEQDTQSEIYLRSGYYHGSYAESFVVEAQDEASKPVEYYVDVENESDDTQLEYFGNNFNLRIFWETCVSDDGAFRCDAKFKARSLNGGKVIKGNCEIQQKFSSPKPRPCHFGVPCH